MARIVADDEFFSRLEKAIGGAAPDAAADEGEPVTKGTKTDVTPEGSKADDAPATEGGAPAKEKKGLGKLRKAIKQQGETVDKLASLFAEGDEAAGVPAGAVLKALTELRADVNAAKTAASSALDGVARVEGKAIKKSLDGQDGKESVTKSSGEELDGLMRGLAANAITRNNRVTLR